MIFNEISQRIDTIKPRRARMMLLSTTLGLLAACSGGASKNIGSSTTTAHAQVTGSTEQALHDKARTVTFDDLGGGSSIIQVYK